MPTHYFTISYDPNPTLLDPLFSIRCNIQTTVYTINAKLTPSFIVTSGKVYYLINTTIYSFFFNSHPKYSQYSNSLKIFNSDTGSIKFLIILVVIYCTSIIKLQTASKHIHPFHRKTSR